jgi:enamine deaminase RidA (YjgF/YER057c/UK114 family)
MKRILLLLAIVLPSTGLSAPATKTLVVPTSQAWAYNDWHFSPAVRVGDVIWLSGQAGDMDGDYRAGAERVFENIRLTLEAAGATLEDVVEIVTYHRDMEKFQEFAAVYHAYFPNNYPAWTAVGVTALADPILDLEIKVTAVAGSGARVEKVTAVTRE